MPCPACGTEMPNADLNKHLASCRAASQRFNGPSSRLGRSADNERRGISAKLVNANHPRPSAPMTLQPADSDGRIPCARCGRKFAQDRIAKHQYICTGLKHGPPRSPSKVGAEAALARGAHSVAVRRSGGTRGRSGSSWRQQSQAFRAAMRAARGLPPARLDDGCGSGAYSGGRAGADNFHPCPHCHRTFGPSAYERHVERCEHIINKPRAPPSSTVLHWPSSVSRYSGEAAGSAVGGQTLRAPRRDSITPLDASRASATAGLSRERQMAFSSSAARPSSRGVANAGLAPGQRVMISGLHARPEINGQHGIVKSVDPEVGRYVVQLQRDPTRLLGIKSANLEIVMAVHRPQSGGDRATARSIAAAAIAGYGAPLPGIGGAGGAGGLRSGGGARLPSRGLQVHMDELVFAGSGDGGGGGRPGYGGGTAQPARRASVGGGGFGFGRMTGRESRIGDNPETRPMQPVRAPAAMASQPMRGGGAGGIDPSNQTSADNPLAGMVSYQTSYSSRR